MERRTCKNKAGMLALSDVSHAPLAPDAYQEPAGHLQAGTLALSDVSHAPLAPNAYQEPRGHFQAACDILTEMQNRLQVTNQEDKMFLLPDMRHAPTPARASHVTENKEPEPTVQANGDTPSTQAGSTVVDTPTSVETALACYGFSTVDSDEHPACAGQEQAQSAQPSCSITVQDAASSPRSHVQCQPLRVVALPVCYLSPRVAKASNQRPNTKADSTVVGTPRQAVVYQSHRVSTDNSEKPSAKADVWDASSPAEAMSQSDHVVQIDMHALTSNTDVTADGAAMSSFEEAKVEEKIVADFTEASTLSLDVGTTVSGISTGGASATMPLSSRLLNREDELLGSQRELVDKLLGSQRELVDKLLGSQRELVKTQAKVVELEHRMEAQQVQASHVAQALAAATLPLSPVEANCKKTSADSGGSGVDGCHTSSELVEKLLGSQQELFKTQRKVVELEHRMEAQQVQASYVAQALAAATLPLSPVEANCEEPSADSADGCHTSSVEDRLSSLENRQLAAAQAKIAELECRMEAQQVQASYVTQALAAATLPLSPVEANCDEPNINSVGSSADGRHTSSIEERLLSLENRQLVAAEAKIAELEHRMEAQQVQASYVTQALAAATLPLSPVEANRDEPSTNEGGSSADGCHTSSIEDRLSSLEIRNLAEAQAKIAELECRMEKQKLRAAQTVARASLLLALEPETPSAVILMDDAIASMAESSAPDFSISSVEATTSSELWGKSLVPIRRSGNAGQEEGVALPLMPL